MIPTAPIAERLKTSGLPKSYQPQLEGLRGIAIISVLLHHFHVHLPGWLDWGPLGVRLFFLLSGYLITLSVWRVAREATESGNLYRSLGVFHLRRAVRLVPVLFIMLGMGWLMGLPEIRDGFWWHALFTTNFYALANDEWPGAASHLWSISVQEQFYILWPFLLLLVPARRLPWALAALIVLAFSFRFYCLHSDASVFMRWLMLPGVIDSFAMGALIACWKSAGCPFSITAGNRRMWLLAAAVGAYSIARILRHATHDSPWLAGIDTLENFALGVVLLQTIHGWKGLIGRVLEAPWLMVLGKISFGLYIFHVLVHVSLSPWLTRFGILDSYSRAAFLIVATIGVAAISWHALEAPLNVLFRKRVRMSPAASPSPVPPISSEISGNRP